jgi:hypothetical protein
MGSRPPPPSEWWRWARSEPATNIRDNEEQGAAGEAERGEGIGGGTWARGGSIVAGGGGWDPGESDSYSEVQGDDRWDWKRYTSRMLQRQERRMMQMLSDMMNGASCDPTALRARDLKEPQPSEFNRVAHDIDWFLLQCEIVFTLEVSSFRNEGFKFRYTGNLLERSTVVNRYEAYHILIHQDTANRDAARLVQLDSHGLSWERFTFSIQQSFGDRVTIEEAVLKWD